MSELEIANMHLIKKLAEAEAHVAELEKGVEEYACTGTDEPCGCYNLITKDRARVAELEAENAKLKAEIREMLEEDCDIQRAIDKAREIFPKGRAQG